MGKYDVVPHAMVRVHADDNNPTSLRVIIDNDTNLVVWSDEHGDYYKDDGNVENWRETIANGEPAPRGEVEDLVRRNFEEPELCLEFLSELEA